MKKKLMAIICIIILILVSIFNRLYDSEKTISNRYEQHINALKTSDSGSIESDDFVSHLPLISINTNEQKIPGTPIYNEDGTFVEYELGDNGEEEIKVEISIFDNEEAQNSISNVATLNAEALFRIRGNTSRSFDKKSYKIKFVNELSEKVDYEVMGMAEGSEWALYGPFLDKTLIRNYMWMNICANIMGYAPNVRFCECYLDGEYQGLYLMMETIEKSENRVNISTYDADSRVVPYIVKLDTFHEEEEECIETFSYYTNILDDGSGISILYPNGDDLTEEVKEYIADDISEFEKVLYSYDFDDPDSGYSQYIDVDSWVDFYIIQEFLVNNDMCARSTYLYKDAGGKLTMGPVWDFNNVCDNYMDDEFSTEGFYYAQIKVWYKMLFKDENFVKKVVERYKELRETYLNADYLETYIDDTINYLGEAIDRNYEVWGYTFERENQIGSKQYLSPSERNPQSYEEAIETYKKFLYDRGVWLDDNIDTLYQYCHESKNKLYIK